MYDQPEWDPKEDLIQQLEDEFLLDQLIEQEEKERNGGQINS